MSPDQKVLHALNRLTFGARAPDLEEVKRIGLDAWIDRQLHPASIPENTTLEARLRPLDSLRMTTADMVRSYPSQQMLRAMIAGRLELPDNPDTRAAVKIAIARFEARKKGMAEPDAASDRALTAAQRQTLSNGAPEEQTALLQTLPPELLGEALRAIPAGARQQLISAASPELLRRIEIMRGPGRIVERDLTDGKLLRAIYGNRQLEEVLTDFWYNHFNVYLNKGADRTLVTSYERDAIRPHVLGKFKDLLVATAQSPAMLFYLDNVQSVSSDVPVRPGQKKRRGLNENYGRELMELHTLGVDGGYTQNDVTEVARCFTGWTIQPSQRGGGGGFQFNWRMHDRGEKHVLGVKIAAGGGMEDGMKVLDILSRHPSTARFISRSLAVRFVSDDPPASLVDTMAKTFLASGGDLREVMTAMIKAPEFWAPAYFRAKVKSPLEMVVSAVRAVDGDVRSAESLAAVMNQLGEPLYRKQEPTGYSNRGVDWMNSASLLARFNFAVSLAQGGIAGVKVDPAKFSGEAQSIERDILLTAASPEARAAIQAGLEQPEQAAQSGSLVAGLTLGSPDFQRR